MNKFILSALVILGSVPAFAGHRLVSCNPTNADEATVDIFENDNGSLVAVVTTDGPGGSYPTYRFKVAQAPSYMSDNSTAFVGPKFSLAMTLNGAQKPGILTASSIGIQKMAVVCR